MNTKSYLDCLTRLRTLGVLLVCLATGLTGCGVDSPPALHESQSDWEETHAPSTSVNRKHNKQIAREPTGERIGLSLRVLMQEAQNAANGGKPVPADINHLMGMTWLEGFVVDDANSDIILVGRRSTERPPLYMDDLVVTLRNIWHRHPHPYCSLDPLPENVVEFQRISVERAVDDSLESFRRNITRLRKAWGPQQVVLGGIPRISRHAHVLINADYRLKKISQSLVKMDGVVSPFDRAIARFQNSVHSGIESSGNRKPSMSRYWFRVREGDPTFRESNKIVFLDQCAVHVHTERQEANIEGKLFDAGGENPDAIAFASDFSKSMESGTSEPIFQDLENLYRLHALFRAMYVRDAVAQSNLDLAFFLHKYRYQEETPMRPYRDGLTNFREIQETVTKDGYVYRYLFFPLVVGGASMEMKVTRRKFIADHTNALKRLQFDVVAQRPHGDALVWSIVS